MLEPEFAIGNIVVTENAGKFTQWTVIGALGDSKEWTYVLESVEVGGDRVRKEVPQSDIVASKVDNRPWEKAGNTTTTINLDLSALG